MQQDSGFADPKTTANRANSHALQRKKFANGRVIMTFKCEVQRNLKRD
jgi:hypothetical protein